MLKKFFTKNRSLGRADERRYDIPLHKASGSAFLKILICLMTILAILALSISFVISGMKERWAAGIQNQATIEILPQDKEGNIRKAADIEALGNIIIEQLEKETAITNIQELSKQEITNLVAPWLGEDLAGGKIPLPGIITVEFLHSEQMNAIDLQNKISVIGANIRLDTHESWLNDIIKFSSMIELFALLISGAIGITIFIAISAAIRSRIAIHQDDLKLLHLMGASDGYIIAQFQKYILILTLQGALIGLAFSFVVFGIIYFVTSGSDIAFLPALELNLQHWFFIIILPFVISLVAMITARYVAYYDLTHMS